MWMLWFRDIAFSNAGESSEKDHHGRIELRKEKKKVIINFPLHS